MLPFWDEAWAWAQLNPSPAQARPGTSLFPEQDHFVPCFWSQNFRISTPSWYAGGSQKMMDLSPMSRQPPWDAWILERLNTELTINLGMAIKHSIHRSYIYALNSYITFCCIHGFDIKPTQHTLALYIVTFQSTYINPKSVDTYLSSICNQIELNFPDVHSTWKSTLVSHALQGVKHHFRALTHQKLPLTEANLLEVLIVYGPSPSHNNILFQLGSSQAKSASWDSQNDTLSICDYNEVICFWFLGHKADQFFEGNCLFICKSSINTFHLFNIYLASHDALFWAWPELWLQFNETIPTHSWFIHWLHYAFQIWSQVCHCISGSRYIPHSYTSSW